ncbi:hypothetical protein FRC07_013303 [Ceratobasidium sp. 392]|nr:hypothetical protein FRC07_013303 [Ceratobasidium sp. 392]
MVLQALSSAHVARLSILDNFLEAQKRSLNELRDDVEKLEELKGRAMAEPTCVLGMLINDDRNPALKTLTSTQNPRATRIRSEIAKLSESLSHLPALPADLLDTTETTVKKRKRVEPINSGPILSTKPGGLRLPFTVSRHEEFGQPEDVSNIPQEPLKQYQRSASSTDSSSGPQEPSMPVTPLEPASQVYLDHSGSQRRTWASKDITAPYTVAQSTSGSRPGSPMSEIEYHQEIQPDDNTAKPSHNTFPLESHNEEQELPTTFKKNWSLDEQHTLERLLVEIPSTVKFRWVKISEAMGGTRTPRQVASRVQKYYEKMKKLGVAVDSTEMGGGGRGGSKATQDLDVPVQKSSTSRSKTHCMRGMPKTGPQYTKSGRRR